METNLDTMRDAIARATQRGVGMPIAGALLWLASAWFGARFSPENAATLTFMATGAVFPLGWWFTKLLGGDLMAKGHAELSRLGMTLNFVQFFYWPIVIVLFFSNVQLVPFALASLFVSHFLPYGWFYRSRGYAFLGIAGPIVATVVQVVAPDAVFVAIPLAMAAMYAIAVGMVLRENRNASPKTLALA